METEELTLSHEQVKSELREVDNGSFTDSNDENRQLWDSVIDQRLIDWGRDPDRFRDDEEGIEPPSSDIVQLAWFFARQLSSLGVSPPLRVVMNGEGGVTFEWRHTEGFFTFEITHDGSIERCQYDRNCRLVTKISQ